jgi:hypothetical protein
MWTHELKQKHAYSTPSVRNTPGYNAGSLPSALSAPHVKIYRAGTLKALEIVQRARWVGESTNTGTHVAPLLWQHLDVILVMNACPPLATKEVAQKYMTVEGKYMCPQRLNKEAGWTIVRRPSLVVRESGMTEIISLYVTASCDPRIADVLKDGEAVQKGMQKYLQRVKFNNKKAMANVYVQRTKAAKAAERGLHGQTMGRPHNALRLIEMDGIHQLRYAYGYGYHSRDTAASKDLVFLESQARLYCGMSCLEAEHVPVISDYRNALSKRVTGFQGIFPGIGKHLCPASSIGASQGYVCDAHNDSCIKGLTESIFWTAPKGSRLPDGEQWTFANVEAGLLFDLQDGARSGGSCIYIPGSVMHNSMPTRCEGHTMHAGMGFVLVTKNSALGTAAQKWFKANPLKLLSPTKIGSKR